jgi:hypothetical protein
MRTRDEHLAWCKRTALDYLMKTRDVAGAIASMLSDLGKHPELEGIAKKMGPVAVFYAMQNDPDRARSFIEGFR